MYPSSLQKTAMRSFTSIHEAQFEPKTYCFDDLGLESNMSFYGNQCSVMAEILLSRYDLLHAHSIITHVTTNLNSTEIDARFGMRMRSRCREIFNLIAFLRES